MALSNPIVRQRYTANGSNTDFAITAGLIEVDSDEVKVYIRDESVDPATETLAVEGSDYDLDGRPTPTDFNTTVVFRTAPASGLIIQVERELDLEQTLELMANGSFNLDDFEIAWDRSMAILQQLAFQLSRSFKYARTSGLTAESIPDPEAGDVVLGRNEDNDGFEWKDVAALVNITGALAIANNLSDLSNVSSALANLGIAPLSTQVSHSFTDGQSATNLTGETADGTVYTSVVYEYEAKRGTTVMATGKLALQYKNSTWTVVDGGYEGDPHGLSFSVSQAGSTAQLRVAASSSGGGNGTLKLKKHNFSV